MIFEWEWDVLHASLSPAAMLGNIKQRKGAEDPADDALSMASMILEAKFSMALQALSKSQLGARPDLAAEGPSMMWEGVTLYLTNYKNNDDDEAGVYLMAAVAALHIFLQANLTGPFPNVPSCPLHLREETDLSEGRKGNDFGLQQASLANGQDLPAEGDRWASKKLCADGEDLLGRVLLPQYLLLAQTILLAPLGLLEVESGPALKTEDGRLEADLLEVKLRGLPATWAWWACRALTAQQRVLSGLSASIRNALHSLTPHVLHSAPPEEALGLVERQQLAVMACLEAANVEQIYGYPSKAADHLAKAQETAGFSAELTGVLGRRTEHQADAKALLMVQTERQHTIFDAEGDAAESLDLSGSDKNVLELATDSNANEDVLDEIRVADGAEHSGREGYTPLEQALLLALGEQHRRSTAKDELRPWQVAAFSDAVLSQISTRYLLRMAAKLSRVRFEKSRSRTRERALLAMEQLINSTAAEKPDAFSRSCFAFAVPLPPIVEMQKEYGEQLVACGLVGSAMEIFERLELWDNLLICYRLLEKVPQALDLVHKRLEAVPGDAKLLCALGDLTSDVAYYQQAWDQSSHRSSRAQRSLAKHYMGRSEFLQAAEHWELALTINPLHPEGWFSLGYCCLKTDKKRRAVQAFSRCTQQQSDNGDAWNNIAALNMQDGKYKEAFSAFKEAAKYKRDSWQLWSNYAAAAMKVDSFQAAARAVEQVGSLTQWQRQELDILEGLVMAIEASQQTKQGKDAGDGEMCTGDKILQQSVQRSLSNMSASSAVPPAVWGLLARLNMAQGSPAAAKEAQRKQLRALGGPSWKQDLHHFVAYAKAIVASAELLLSSESIDSKENAKELSSMRMLMQNLLKAAPEAFQREGVVSEVRATLEAIQRAPRNQKQTRS